MSPYTLAKPELSKLRRLHRRTREKRHADRLKAVILLGSGWSAEQVAEALMVDPDTVRAHFKRYRSGGVEQLLKMAYKGSKCDLTDEQLIELNVHLENNLYLTAADVARYVEEQWGVRYTARGMTELLHRLGYVYKKPKLVPGKADAEAQEAFVEEYENLKKNKDDSDPIYFMDATHPQHNPVQAYGWIKRGEERPIPTNTGRDRLNINGAIDADRMTAEVRFDPTINAASTVALFDQLEQANPEAKTIYVICDNARYYRSKQVKEYLKDSKINLIFLPPYSPNLNLIERYWKFFKKKVLYNTYYATFSEFKYACEDFFADCRSHVEQLRSLLTENFQIISN
jgi:transposase